MNKCNYESDKLNDRIVDNFKETSISKISYSLLTDEYIKRVSVVKITSNSIDPNDMNGVNSKLLGTIEDNVNCETCNNSKKKCIGHYGRIELKIPVINPEMKLLVLNILNIVCNTCGKLLIPENIIHNNPQFNSRYVVEKVQLLKKYADKNKNCYRHLADKSTPCPPSPNYKANDNKDNHNITYTLNGIGSNIRTTEEILKILMSISEKDALLMGFKPKGPRPADLIFKSVLVVPPICRPPITANGELKSDFITTSYINIISVNNKINSSLNENERSVQEKKLNMHFYHLISASTENIQNKNGGKSLKHKIDKKNGLMRAKSMGKRVEYVVRTVLGPFNEIPFGYVGIPAELANSMSTTETVTKYNFKRLERMYNDNQIFEKNPKDPKYQNQLMKILKTNKKSLSLEIGDVVHRRIVNGDLITFNRQPTLHKGSMMGFRIFIHDGMTLRIPSDCTEATNADFDGDEGNGYIHQKIETKIEMKYIANTMNCISNYQSSTVMTGLYYHDIIGGYMLSDPNIILQDNLWEEGIKFFGKKIWNPNDKLPDKFKTLKSRCEKYNIRWKSGQCLLSLLFPEDFYLNCNGITIIDGILINGRICKKNLNGFGIIHHFCKNYGDYMAANFITEARWLFSWYITRVPLSIGICHILPDNIESIVEFIKERLFQTQKTVDEFYKLPDTDTEREIKILSALAKIEDSTMKKMKKFIQENNSFVEICNSGAKGSTSNIKCMMVMCGQELNGNERPSNMYSDKTRYCIFSDFNSNEVCDRGFIKNGFTQGISPQEFLVHIDSGRDGINKSNLKTPKTGFFSRQSHMLMNSTIIGYQGEVCSTDNHIYSFLYGSGFDVGKTTISYSPLHNNSNRRMPVNLQHLAEWCNNMNFK